MLRDDKNIFQRCLDFHFLIKFDFEEEGERDEIVKKLVSISYVVSIGFDK